MFARRFFSLQEIEFVPRKMDITSQLSHSDTEVLLQACATFNASDNAERAVMQMMVLPMLERRLESLYMAVRAAPQNPTLRFAIQQSESALGDASARLDTSRTQRD